MVAAAGRGFLAFVGTALAGQLVGFATWLAGARAYGARLPLKLGWLYLVSFHRVGIRLTATGPFMIGDAPAPTADSAAPNAPSVFTVRVAVLLGTILAGFLLLRAGRRCARRARDAAWVGTGVALGYAAPIFLGSLAVTLRFPDADIEGIRPIAWEAFAFPGLFAIVVATAGALSTATFERTAARVRTWFWTGARMFAAAILLAFVGFVVLAGVRPDASSAYVRWIGRTSNIGALVATNHVLLLPDQSIWILTPSMGSCDEFTSARSELMRLCGLSLAGGQDAGEIVLGRSLQVGNLSTPFLLFVLVPGIAVLAGAARSSDAGSLNARIVDGALAGLVFAVLVWIGAIVSRVSIGDPVSGVLLSAGPEPVRTGLLALAWGMVGGAIGSGLFPTRLQVAVGVSEAAPAPPSPTSV